MDEELVEYSPQELIAEVKATISSQELNDETFKQIGDLLHKLASRSDLKSIGEHRGKGVNAVDSYVLYRDDEPDGPIIILAEFDKPTKIHNHGTWGVMCAYEGREKYKQWKRMDNGDELGKATLRLVTDIVLDVGDIVWWPDVPNDIHMQDPIDDSMWQLVLMGRNTLGGDEEHYDPDLGLRWPADIPPHMRSSKTRG